MSFQLIEERANSTLQHGELTASHKQSEKNKFGDKINLGILAAVASLGYADWRHPEDDWRAGRVALADWYERISERASVKRTAPIF